MAEFLGLTQAQSDLIEIKLAFTDALKRQRTASGLSQAELAEKIGSSQSRIAKMEAGDPHILLDLMIRALLAAGMSRVELADADAGKQPLSAADGTRRRHALKTSVPQPQAGKA